MACKAIGWKGVWIGLIWLRIATSGRLLWMRSRTLSLYKIQGIWLALEALTSKEGLCFVVLFNLYMGCSLVAFLIILTLFSWCLLFLMIVIMILWMKKERAAMPDRAGNVILKNGVKWIDVTLVKSTLMPKLADLTVTKSSMYTTDSVPAT